MENYDDHVDDWLWAALKDLEEGERQQLLAAKKRVKELFRIPEDEYQNERTSLAVLLGQWERNKFSKMYNRYYLINDLEILNNADKNMSYSDYCRSKYKMLEDIKSTIMDMEYLYEVKKKQAYKKGLLKK